MSKCRAELGHEGARSVVISRHQTSNPLIKFYRRKQRSPQVGCQPNVTSDLAVTSRFERWWNIMWSPYNHGSINYPCFRCFLAKATWKVFGHIYPHGTYLMRRRVISTVWKTDFEKDCQTLVQRIIGSKMQWPVKMELWMASVCRPRETETANCELKKW